MEVSFGPQNREIGRSFAFSLTPISQTFEQKRRRKKRKKSFQLNYQCLGLIMFLYSISPWENSCYWCFRESEMSFLQKEEGKGKNLFSNKILITISLPTVAIKITNKGRFLHMEKEEKVKRIECVTVTSFDSTVVSH